MGSTDPLTGSRFPYGSDAATIAQYIENAVRDLSDNTIPSFTSTALRDTAYANWVSAGNTMRDGLTCRVAGDLYGYKSGGWKREIDAGRPRARLYRSETPAPGNGTLFGLGPVGPVTMQTAFNGSTFYSQRQDGMDVQPGIYAVTYNLQITSGGSTTSRSLLDIVGNTDNAILSRAPMTWPGEPYGTNSTTLFLPAAQQVRFLMYLNCSVSAVNVIGNVDIVRLGDF